MNLPAWVRYPDFERVQWVNELMSQLWPNAQAAAAAMVREQLDPMLKAYKPAWIYDIGIHTFTLGDRPPKISAVKASVLTSSRCSQNRQTALICSITQPASGFRLSSMARTSPDLKNTSLSQMAPVISGESFVNIQLLAKFQTQPLALVALVTLYLKQLHCRCGSHA